MKKFFSKIKIWFFFVQIKLIYYLKKFFDIIKISNWSYIISINNLRLIK